MPRRRTTIIVTAVAVVALAGLGAGVWGVTNMMNNSFHIGAGPAAAATKAPSSTPTPTVVPIGGILDEQTALDLRREMPDNGDFAYKMPNGQWIKINRNQPLPSTVIAAEQAQLDQLPVQPGTTPNDVTAGVKAATAAAGASTYRTGRKTLLISRIPVATGGGANGLKWVIMGGLEKNLPTGIGGNGWDDENTALQKAQALVAAQPDAANWDIIVAHQH